MYYYLFFPFFLVHCRDSYSNNKFTLECIVQQQTGKIFEGIKQTENLILCLKRKETRLKIAPKQIFNKFLCFSINKQRKWINTNKNVFTMWFIEVVDIVLLQWSNVCYDNKLEFGYCFVIKQNYFFSNVSVSFYYCFFSE